MLRRSHVLLSKSKRQIVRDPRKRVPVVVPRQEINPVEHQERERKSLAFEPSVENQQTVGSALGSYMLAGAGMSLGFIVVGAIFGGF
jgi:hypothetical protein